MFPPRAMAMCRRPGDSGTAAVLGAFKPALEQTAYVSGATRSSHETPWRRHSLPNSAAALGPAGVSRLGGASDRHRAEQGTPFDVNVEHREDCIPHRFMFFIPSHLGACVRTRACAAQTRMNTHTQDVLAVVSSSQERCTLS